jgi:hypothetical protein
MCLRRGMVMGGRGRGRGFRVGREEGNCEYEVEDGYGGRELG